MRPLTPEPRTPADSDPDPPGSSAWRHRLEGVVLFALPFLVYGLGLGYGLLGYDDTRYYLENQALHAGARGLIDVWRAPFYSDYMPVTQWTLWLDLTLFGDRSWWGARLQSLAWFGAGTLAVRAVVARITGRRDIAFAVALLYALHPVAAHSILWLAQRKSLVAFALGLWSVERYVAARRSLEGRPRWIAGLASYALMLLALLAKAHAVAIPAMLAACEIALPRGSRRVRAAALTPFAATAALFVVASLGWVRGDLGRELLGGSRLAAMAASGPIALRYLGHTVAPFGPTLEPRLSFLYAVNESPGALGWGAWCLVVLLAAASVAVVRQRRVVAWAWAFALAGLLPALNLVAQPQPMADQYHLWALPGLLVAVVWLGERLLAGRDTSPSKSARIAVCGGAALLLALASGQRVSEYASPLDLYAAATSHQPASALAWSEYSRALMRSRDPQQRARAGAAARQALTRPDVDRILGADRAVLVGESALALHRAGEAERARTWLEDELAKLPPGSRTLAAIAHAEFAIRTGEPERAVKLLAPAFRRVPRKAVERLRARSRTGATLPDRVRPRIALALGGDDADRTFTRRIALRRLQLLASAYHAAGRLEAAFEVAAVLVNVAPDYRPGRRILAAIYRDLGVPEAAQALLDP